MGTNIHEVYHRVRGAVPKAAIPEEPEEREASEASEDGASSVDTDSYQQTENAGWVPRFLATVTNEPLSFLRAIHPWPLKFKSSEYELEYDASNVRIGAYMQTFILLLVTIISIVIVGIEFTANLPTRPANWMAMRLVTMVVTFTGLLILLLPVTWHFIRRTHPRNMILHPAVFFAVSISILMVQKLYYMVRDIIFNNNWSDVQFRHDATFHAPIESFTYTYALIFVNETLFIRQKNAYVYNVIVCALLTYVRIFNHYWHGGSRYGLMEISYELMQILLLVFMMASYFVDLQERASFHERKEVESTVRRYDKRADPLEALAKPLTETDSTAEIISLQIRRVKDVCHKMIISKPQVTSKMMRVLKSLDRITTTLTEEATIDEDVILHNLTPAERKCFEAAGVLLIQNLGLGAGNTRIPYPPVEPPPEVDLPNLHLSWKPTWPLAQIMLWATKPGLFFDPFNDCINAPTGPAVPILETCRAAIHKYRMIGPDKEHQIYELIICLAGGSAESPYSNGLKICHATNVLFYLLEQLKVMPLLSNSHILCVLIASFARQFGISGFSSTFLAECNHRLSLLYNDYAPRSRFVSFAAIRLLQTPECNIFADLPLEERSACYRFISNLTGALFSTDHFLDISRLRLRLNGNQFAPATNSDDLYLLLRIVMRVSELTRVWSRVPPHNEEYSKWLWCASRRESQLEAEAERDALMQFNEAPLERGQFMTTKGYHVYLNTVVKPLTQVLSLLSLPSSITDYLLDDPAYGDDGVRFSKAPNAGSEFPLHVLRAMFLSRTIHELFHVYYAQIDATQAKAQLATTTSRYLRLLLTRKDP